MELSRGRIEWIDIAKGISIILVVYGHAGIATVPFLGPFLISFRMPFFFLCSGILFKYVNYPTLRDLLVRRYYTLIRPFFVFSFIVMLLEYFIQHDYIGFLKTTLIEGWGGYALWFIPVLLGTEIWYYVICKLAKNRVSAKILLVFISTVLGYITYYYKVPNNYDCCFILTSVFFYCIGNILRDKIILYFNSSSSLKIFLTCIALFILTCSYILSPALPEFATNILVGPITYLAGISGGLMMCCIAALFSRLSWLPILSFKTVIISAGMNSYIILAFHQIILLLLGEYTTLSGWIQRCIMWSLLIILVYITSNFFPEILGRQKKS